MVGKKEGTGAGRILLWSSLFLMLWSSPIKKKHGFSLSLSHMSVGSSELTLQWAWLWMSTVVAVSWRLVLCVRRLSPKGIGDRLQPRLSNYPCLLVLGLPSRSLNHSLIFQFFPQLVFTWLLYGVVAAVAGTVIDLFSGPCPLRAKASNTAFLLNESIWLVTSGGTLWDRYYH